MKHNLNGKIFRSIQNTGNGDVDHETLFYYHQKEDVVTAEYSGGNILHGYLTGRILVSGQLDLWYYHINKKGELMVGTCLSNPKLLPDGRIRLRKKWRWLTGDQSSENLLMKK